MWCVTVAVVVGAASGPLELARLGDGAALVELVWQQAPELQQARVRMAQLEAERRKALRLPNPGLDIGLNTLPVGPLNPPELTDPFLNVPNLAIGVSVLLELGKREPRQDATAQASRAAALDAIDQLRRKVLELEDIIGDAAAAQARVEALQGLADDARELSELQQARARKGDTSELDADRALLELEGTRTALGEARQQLSVSLRGCAEVLSVPCTPFADATQALAWLDRRVGTALPALEHRPDLKALEAAVASAKASQLLASRGWLPDPTVRLGYVRDQFVVSGNQLNSLFVGVTLPLPLFERGLDDAEAAGVAARTAERTREQLLAAARVQLEHLHAEIATLEARQQRLKDQSVPLAQSVVARLASAVTRGAAPLQELLLARRTLAELLLAATEIDRTTFHLHVARARLSSSLDALPAP